MAFIIGGNLNVILGQRFGELESLSIQTLVRDGFQTTSPLNE